MLDLETFATAVRNVPLWFVNIFVLGLSLRYQYLGLLESTVKKTQSKKEFVLVGCFSLR